MSRGSAGFTTMKGFHAGDDFVIKGDGHEPETLPDELGEDITEEAELDSAGVNAPHGSNIKKTDNTPATTSTSMSPELEEVAEAAQEDIADGYVADAQHLPGPGTRAEKGFEAYNHMVSKGIAVDTTPVDRYDVGGSMDLIQKEADMEFAMQESYTDPWSTMEIKSFDNDLSLKGYGGSPYDMMYKGDPEDMSMSDGYVEEDLDETQEQASDDTKGVQGENDSTPQTEEAEAEEEDESNAETGLVGEPEEKGWAAYNNMVQKGFVTDIEEKAYFGNKSHWRSAKELLGKAKKAYRKGNKPKAKDKLKEALSETKTHVSQEGKRLGKEYGKTAAGVTAGAGIAGGGGYYAYDKYGKKRKKKGFEAYDEMVQKGMAVDLSPSGGDTGMVTKGFEDDMEMKLFGKVQPASTTIKNLLKQAKKAAKNKDWRAARRNLGAAAKESGGAVKAGAKNNKGKLIGGGVLAAGGGGAYAYDKYGKRKKKR